MNQYPFDTPIPGVGMFHTPQFAIYGSARKELIKKRNSLRSFIRGFKWNTSINNDLYAIYNSPQYIIDEKKQEEILAKAQADLDEMNQQLMKPYDKS
jgi:hypothetical protein